MGLVLNGYSTLPAVRAALGIHDVADDAKLEACITAASRQIDIFCRRSFFTRSATLTFTPRSRYALIFRDVDLLSITTLKTDPAGARAFGTSWAATDWDMGPASAPVISPPEPYTYVTVTPSSLLTFPLFPNSVQIVGTWGYPSVLERAPVALGGAGLAASAAATTATVSDVTAFAIGQTLLIGSEQVAVTQTGSAPGTLTLVRGINGTVIAAHVATDPIDIYTYPLVGAATLLATERLWTRRDSPQGVSAGSNFGGGDVDEELDPDVQRLIYRLQRDYDRPLVPLRRKLAVA